MIENKHTIFKPKKTRYRLGLVWLIALVTTIILSLFRRLGIEDYFYTILSGGFGFLIIYYLWREHEDKIHTEVIDEKEFQKRIENLENKTKD